MKRPRLLATIMVTAAAFLVTGCGVDIENHPKQLAAAEDRIRDAVVEAGSPGVIDARVKVLVDDYVLLKFGMTIDAQAFDENTMCASIKELVANVPFDTTRILGISLLLPGETSPSIRVSPYLSKLGVTEFLDEFGRPSTNPKQSSSIWWKDAQAIAASCS